MCAALGSFSVLPVVESGNDHPCLAWPSPLPRTDACWTEATNVAKHHAE
jgi:hypothetical protein